MSVLKPDLCVIGAGSGGLSVASGAVQMGASVVLVEGGEMGGDCLNYGCVPSKALLAAGKAAQARRTGARFGVAEAEPEVDFAAAKDHVGRVIASIAPHDSQERFEGLGVTVIRDWARFASPEEVVARETRIRARRFVIASGSSPAAPPVPGLEDVPYLTNETVFSLRERPERLLVLGGGPIGMEMAQAHWRLGCEVVVIEADRALGREDPEAAEVVVAALRGEGVEIVEGAKIAAARAEDGGVALEDAEGRVWRGSHLLVAAGRRPNLEKLDPAAGGVEVTKAGVKVDRGLRSVSNRRVHAVGDAAGGLQFTHLAGWHAGLVIRSALFRLPVTAEPSGFPRVTYTDPELAQVGPTEAEARAAHGGRLEVIRVDYAENDRARAEGAETGFLKLMVVRGRPVGATMVGRSAGELCQVWALAISSGMKLSKVAGMIAPYPTLGEISKAAAGKHFAPKLFGSPWVKRAVRLLAKLG
ncbi:MAG: dihydrolipoyl dehydrogenase family protein [Pseudomonadota bacterium]